LNEPELNGVNEVPAKPDISLTTLVSGQFQTDFENYWKYKLATRKINTSLYNQLLYSLFGSTDSSTILVGQDKYLFEKAYPSAYLTEVASWQVPALTEKIDDLVELNQLLKQRGVVLAVRISPTKAEHYPEYLPTGYNRFVGMKQNGEYGPNWYDVFMDEIKKTDIPVYDRYDLIEEMKRGGDIVFTKGGTHWSLAPMAEYINGFNSLLEELLNKKLGRLIVTSEENIDGQMGIPDDRDLWNICWNAMFAEPDYPSPNITLDTIPGDFRPNVLNVGQSFSTILLYAIYFNIENPVWNETLFSWYNGRVLRYPNHGLPWGEHIADRTGDFEYYLDMDVIVIEFLENTTYPGAVQFEFVNNILNYLTSREG
jgi:hypothetical protein